jgi:hypothetical protein
MLEEIGVRSRMTDIPPKTKIIEGREIRKKSSRVLVTGSCVEFRQERQRWYPEDKRVPVDLKLTPLVIALWFAGDGTYDPSGVLRFCTNGFRQSDVERLAAGLTVLGVESRPIPTPRVGQYTISITQKVAACRLKEMIFPHLTACCHYKLEYVRPPKTLNKVRF